MMLPVGKITHKYWEQENEREGNKIYHGKQLEV